MLANGIDLLTVSRCLRHTRASTTLDTYAHMVSGTQEKAAALMDELTTPVSLTTDLIAPKEPVAPGLHRESDASLDRPDLIHFPIKKLNEKPPEI